MSNRFVFRKDLDWPYGAVTLNGASDNSKYLRYENGVIFKSLTGHVDSVHNDGATPVYRSYIIRDFTVRGEIEFYTRLSRNHYVSYVDVCCYYAFDLSGFNLPTEPINKEKLPMYSRTNNILFFNRYRPKSRRYLGESPFVQTGNDAVVTVVQFDLKTKRNVVINPNAYIILYIMVYTNKEFIYNQENLIVRNIDVDVKYDTN